MGIATRSVNLRGARGWIGGAVDATDGRVGSVVDVFFDDWTWTVRFLAVDARRWLPGRTVLLAPEAFQEVAQSGKAFRVGETREKIGNSPPVETPQPVSRQMEATLRAYYHWSRYWTHADPFFPDTEDVEPALPQTHRARERALQLAEPSLDEIGWVERHLRSLREVTGYAVHAKDDDGGRVKDLIVDLDTWAVRYLVVAPCTWWPAEKVLVPIDRIRGISWQEQAVLVDLSREQIRRCPKPGGETPSTGEPFHQAWDRS